MFGAVDDSERAVVRDLLASLRIIHQSLHINLNQLLLPIPKPIPMPREDDSRIMMMMIISMCRTQCKQWQRRCRALVQCCEPVVEWRVRGGRGRGKEAPLLGAALLLALAAWQARCVLAGWPQAIERNLERDPRAAAYCRVACVAGGCRRSGVGAGALSPGAMRAPSNEARRVPDGC